MATTGAHAVSAYSGRRAVGEIIALNAGTTQKLNNADTSAPRSAPHRLTMARRKIVDPKTAAGAVPSSNNRA